MRRIAVTAISVMLTGCVTGAPPPAVREVPSMWVDVTNASGQDVEVSYEYVSPAAGGAGAGRTTVHACRRRALNLGTLAGEYKLLIDGKTAIEAAVPLEVAGNSFIVVRVRIGPDGEVEALPPVVEGEQIAVDEAVPGCGEDSWRPIWLALRPSSR